MITQFTPITDLKIMGMLDWAKKTPEPHLIFWQIWARTGGRLWMWFNSRICQNWFNSCVLLFCKKDAKSCLVTISRSKTSFLVLVLVGIGLRTEAHKPMCLCCSTSGHSTASQLLKVLITTGLPNRGREPVPGRMQGVYSGIFQLVCANPLLHELVLMWGHQLVTC